MPTLASVRCQIKTSILTGAFHESSVMSAAGWVFCFGFSFLLALICFYCVYFLMSLLLGFLGWFVMISCVYEFYLLRAAWWIVQGGKTENEYVKEPGGGNQLQHPILGWIQVFGLSSRLTNSKTELPKRLPAVAHGDPRT